MISSKNEFSPLFTLVFRAYKYRLYPTKDQCVLINKHIGANRFLYNLALETKKSAYAGAKINLSRFELQKEIPLLKKELPWLKEVNSQTLQYALICLDTAYKNFFKYGSGFPQYKSKHKKQSFGVPQSVLVDDNKLVIPKFKEGIKMVLHRPINGEIKQATISRTTTDKYFVSILVDDGMDVPLKKEPVETTSIGIDLGLKHFLTTSDGTKIENPRHLKGAMERLKFIQRKYSKHKGRKTKKRLQLLHEKVTNARRDFLHKTSSRLVSESQTICLEDLNVIGMMKNHRLAEAIQDASWSTFMEMIRYKTEWRGENVLFIGQFDPSSKLCSNCGRINRNLTLSDREWTCCCGSILDRDVNAAKNIKAFALQKLSVERRLENHGELPTLVGALTREAHSSALAGK